MSVAVMAFLLWAIPAKGARVDGDWYRDQRRSAETACRESLKKIQESKRLIEEALRLSARAPAEDMAGRGVVRQAEFKARSATAKNKLWHERSCRRAKILGSAFRADAGGDSQMPVYARGDVRIDGKPWDGKSPLQPGQVLKTGKDGYAEIALPGSGEVRVGPNTAYVLSKNPKDAPLFEKGEFYYLRVKKEFEDAAQGRHRFAVRTPTAVAGTRGTRFVMVVPPKGACKMGVLEGGVALVDVKSGKETLVQAGQQLIFEDAATIVRGPEHLDPAQFQKAVEP